MFILGVWSDSYNFEWAPLRRHLVWFSHQMYSARDIHLYFDDILNILAGSSYFHC